MAEGDGAAVLDLLERAAVLRLHGGQGHRVKTATSDGARGRAGVGRSWRKLLDEVVEEMAEKMKRCSAARRSVTAATDSASRVAISLQVAARVAMKGGASSTWSPLLAVDRAADRIAQQAARHGFLLDRARAACSAGSKGVLLARSATSSTPQKRPRPRMSPTCGCSPKRLAQHRAEGLAVCAHLGQQAVALDHLLHRERRGAGHRVPEVGMAVLEEAAAAATWPRRSSAAPAPRRSAGSRRPGPWRWSRGRAPRPPARRRRACRCGPCRTSPRRGSAARRGGRRPRAPP